MMGLLERLRPARETEEPAEETRTPAHEPEKLTEQTSTPDLETDVVYDILRNERRRRVLEYLHDESEGSVSVGALAEHLADEDTSQARKRCYIALVQSHLPRMDSREIIEYDDRAKEVTRTESCDLLYRIHRQTKDLLV